MVKKMQIPPMIHRRDLFYVEDDFGHYVTGDKWTGGGDTDAPEMVADVVHGRVRLVTTAVDNEETWLHTTQESFLFQDAKPLHFEWEGYYAEVTGDTLSLFVGCMNALATTPMQDDGAGPKNFIGFGFFRVGSTAGAPDNANVWHTIINNGTDAALTQALTLANTRNLSAKKQDADADTLVNFQALWTPLGLVTATVLEADCDFWVDGIQVVHETMQMTIAQFTEMHFGMAIHNGDAQISSLYCDYASASQLRIDAI